MPGKIGVKIKAGRNLPVMDRGSDTTDAYVEIKLGNTTYKTEVYRKSLNPQWNTDWFRFEVDDSELQDEPLQIRLMDYDTYSANDAIGKVNISLNPLCLETTGQTSHGKGTVMSGWIPVFDTMHGIRGEVNVIVKVDLFSDVNKFRQSSCGIPFFHSQCIPHGYRAQVIHGFVEELVVNDDPEYQWIDKIRTPRASNEARQVVFLKLSGQVQRKMGLKAINMGANAVIGYTQCFDLEGDVGVVARGIGTAVTLIKDANVLPLSADNALVEERVLNYLDFLTGNSNNRNRSPAGEGGEKPYALFDKPGYEIEIQKSSSASLFELKKLSAANYEPDIMLDLIRQEDERGEKPPKKFKQHMKRFTRSSRNIFNETYTAFMQKLNDSTESKSSRSLTSLLTTTGSIKEESASSVRSSTLDVRRLNRKELKKLAPSKPLSQRGSFRKTGHIIHRSISDNTAMQKHLQSSPADNRAAGAVAGTGAGTTAAGAANVPDDYRDSTRSSPNICTAEQRAFRKRTLATSKAVRGSKDSGHQLFGEFSDHTTHLMGGQEAGSISKPYGSATRSLSLSDSSEEEPDDYEDEEDSSDDEEEEEEEAEEEHEEEPNCPANEFPEYDNADLRKMETLMKNCNCNEEDQMAQQWIQPGQADSNDDGLDDASRNKHSFLADLKNFSHHVQEFLKRKKPRPAHLKRHPTLSESLSLKYFSHSERKAYYSSQPELYSGAIAEAIAQTTMLAVPSSAFAACALMQRSLSLTNLTLLSSAAGADGRPVTLPPPQPLAPLAAVDSPPLSPQPPPIYPVLKICPSTPTPTDCDKKNFTDIVAAAPPQPAPQPSFSVTAFEFSHQQRRDPPPPSADCSSSPPIDSPRKARYRKAKQLTNHSTLLVAPFLSPPLPCKSSSQIIVSQRHPHGLRQSHHRSLNEISSTSGGGGAGGNSGSQGTVSGSAITDSPCMKRNGSPASAAIVAASGGPPPGNAAATGGQPLANGSCAGPLSESSSKLMTTSPSRSAATNPSQSDSLSSTTTTSTATTTVLAKEVGEICRRSSDSDLSVTPKGNSLCVASERLVAATALMRLNQPISAKSGTNDGIDMLEYPFLTMTKYPAGFILHLGATVAARSVKLLERVPNPDEPEVRDSWWTEIRMEIRSHARALGCNVVLGYSEATTISDDVCVLSATGTAAVINMAYHRSVSQSDIITMTKASLGGSGGMSSSLEERDILKEASRSSYAAGVGGGGGASTEGSSSGGVKENVISFIGGAGPQQPGSILPNAGPRKFGQYMKNSCSICHIPYNLPSVPFNAKMKRCSICRKGRVPDVLLATLEVPESIAVTGRGCFMQAQVVRAKKDLRSELNAKEISDGLPFLEYELHRVLINKLKAKGMNAIFGLKAQVSIGERMIALIATGTALFLTALPEPQVPKIVAGNSWTDKQKLNEIQKKLQDTFERNQEVYQLKCIDPDGGGSGGAGATTGVAGVGDKPQQQQSDTDESDDDVMEMDLNFGNKDTCVLEVDDIEDLEIISLLMESHPPEGFHVVNTQMVPGIVDMEAIKNLQMFTQVWRAKLDVTQNISSFPKHFQRLLQTIYFKLRTMIPCAICDLRFRLDLPETDQIQLLVTGMAIGLADANKFKYRRKHVAGTGGSVSLNGDVGCSTNGSAGESPPIQPPQSNKRTLQEEDYIFPLDEDQMVQTPTPTSNVPQYGSHSFKLRKTSPSRATSKTCAPSTAVRNRFFPLRDRHGVDITPLSFIPGARIEKYLGNLNFFFIRESTSIRENGGISGFVHGFITELLAVVRAHIAALGGNAMVSFYMTELILFDNQHKNQGQCLISIGGDVVQVSYFNGE